MPYKDKNKRKEAAKGYQKKYYNKHKKYYSTKARQREEQIQMEIESIKSLYGCKICGEKDYVVLDFHHQNPSKKEFNISSAVTAGWSFQRIKVEIQKCIVVCANCHRRLHHKN